MSKVLVVEDDRDLNRFACTCLNDAGFEVISCADGCEAIDAFERTKFDVVLTAKSYLRCL